MFVQSASQLLFFALKRPAVQRSGHQGNEPGIERSQVGLHYSPQVFRMFSATAFRCLDG
jgi:hypothetical protein